MDSVAFEKTVVGTVRNLLANGVSETTIMAALVSSQDEVPVTLNGGGDPMGACRYTSGGQEYCQLLSATQCSVIQGATHTAGKDCAGNDL